MLSSVLMIAAVLLCFMLAVLNLASENRFKQWIIQGAAVLAVLTGAVCYGYGYAVCHGMRLSSLVRALLAMCRMFAGVNDLESIASAPLMARPWMQTLFWAGHFMAFYVTASAAIATLGEQLLRQIRVTLLRRGTLVLIYGINARSVAYGRRLARDRDHAVVFVDQEDGGAFEESIRAFGAVADRGPEAIRGSRRFLRRLNMEPGSRKMEVAALHMDGRRNLAYARDLLESMTAEGIRPSQIRLVAAGTGDEVAALQSMGGKGYGSVYAFDDYTLTARLMLRDHPPCNLISFDENGRAREDLHVVILGFGCMGRALLSQLVVNGQFCGSAFRADIFDPAAQAGFLYGHPMMRTYDIRFHNVSGASEEFYRFLDKYRGSIRLICLCTGTQEKNREMAGDITRWYHWGEMPPLILHATRERYFWIDESRREMRSPHFFDRDGLDLEEMDAMAMQVNHVYCQEMGSVDDASSEWERCDYASRQASRASADFYPAMLRAAGRTASQVLSGQWPPQGAMLENLSVTEHLRWCACQVVEGYSPMPREVWEERAARYREQLSRGEKPSLRIGKDPERRLQACLIPWEDLDELSRRENEVTGGHVDYRQMDRNNVIMLSRVLMARKGREKPADE